MKRKPNGYWTYEKCKDVALKYNSSTDMNIKHASVYNKIRKNKWFELQEHFTRLKKPNGYWTYKKCKDVALKYEFIVDFDTNNSTAYRTILRNKWHDLLNHMKRIGNEYNRLIYVYEFEDNCCYVGLTGNIKRRQIQHFGNDKNSSVFKHILKTKLTPNILLKSDYIPVEDAILLEEKILNNYKNNNWTILNKVKTGGVGSCDVKWTKDTCRTEASKYNNASQFNKKSSGAYCSSVKHGWLDEFFPMTSKNGYWNDKKLCKKEATKYKSRSDFCQGCWSAYNYSNINNWLNDFFPKYHKKSI